MAGHAEGAGRSDGRGRGEDEADDRSREEPPRDEQRDRADDQEAPPLAARRLTADPERREQPGRAAVGADRGEDLAEAVVGGRLVITWSSATALLEISGPGVTKASTLALLCADLGIGAADVIAFGDMPNDLPMLTWAGRGVAVANAHPDVLAAADEVTTSNDDDGVAEVLSRWF